MFLSKHKNGFYYVYYIDPISNKRKSISTKTKLKSEANQFLSEFTKELKVRKKQKTIPINLKDFIFEFLKYSKSIHSENTTKTYKSTFKYLYSYFGNVEISNIDNKDLMNYFEYRIRISSIYRARIDRISLGSAFNRAVTDKYLLNNPCNGIKRFRIPEKQPLFFSETEYQKLLSVIDNKDLKDLVEMALNTGLRQMELLTLEWNQINFKDKLLILDNRNHLTKSKKIRTIPLNIRALQILTERERNKNSNFIFTYLKEPIKQDFISKTFKKFVKKTKLNDKLNFHSLRHTFASWLVQKGVSIYEVSKLLGHSSISVTEIYSHIRTDDLRTAVDRLN